jgi:hypothetical protein
MTWDDILPGLTLLLIASAAWTFLRNAVSNLTDEVVPQEARLLETYYTERGYKVLSIQRESTRAILRHSIRRRGPIRTYAITVQRPDGELETRVRGVARGEREALTLWRFAKDGSPEQMF